MGGEGRRFGFFNLIIFAQRFARKVISIISRPQDGPLRDRSLFMGGGRGAVWGGPEILRGGITYFWQVADGGTAYFFGAKNLGKARETHFYTRFGQI